MRIKRLDITGFKSFMDRCVFSFEDGITGVVGPNGCGKSNVVDAIRWVMGEQSAKNLRGRGMEDVIFNGSESKAPLSMAEVSLTFVVDAQDALAPEYLGLPEITITRRLFRSGESEYLINKTVCRLLDIVELFLGTGVGTRAYSIIEQGRVGLIVSSKPEDRRSLIEEAAGVTKYKARRKAAERKIEATSANLLRLNDLVGELEKRLDSLSRQAKKAERYRSLKAKAREIELHHTSHRWLALAAEQTMLRARVEALGEDERGAVGEVRGLEAAIEAHRGALEEEARALEALGARVHQRKSDTERDAQALAYWSTDRGVAEATARGAQDELDTLTAHREALATRVEALEADLLLLTDASGEDEAAMRRAQEGIEAVSAMQGEATGRLESERIALLGLAGRIANHENNLVNLEKQREDLGTRAARAREEAEAASVTEHALDRERHELGRRVNASRQMTLQLAERRGTEEETLTRLRAAFAESEVAVIALREELADKRSRLTSLEEIQRHYEGFDRGVRAVMLRAGDSAREQGIFGLVADVLTTSARYEKAVEAALGGRLQHVLVESREVALELARYLRSVAEGRSSFLPVPALRTMTALGAPPLGSPGVLAAAAREVSCEPAVQEVAEALLADVLIVEDLDAARSLADAEGAGWTLVTLEGEVLHRDGTVTGGVLEGPAVGALQKKREIAELTEEVHLLEERYGETVTRHYALQKQILQTDEVLRSLAKNQHEEELNRSVLEKDLQQAGESLSRVRERLQSLGLEAEALGSALARLDREGEESRGELAHGHAERATREDRVRELSGRIDRLKSSAEAHAAELLARRVKVAAHAERAEAARRELGLSQVQRRELETRACKLEETHASASARREELQRRIEETESLQSRALAELGSEAAGLEARRRAHAETTARTRAEELRLRELRTRLDGLISGLGQISLRERELSLEMNHLVEGVRERHSLELGEALQRFHLAPELPAESEQALRELRAQIERMGEINLTAIDEHAEVNARFTFLSGQKKDLETSLAELREAIGRIDRTSRERFAKTFEVVNEKFQKVFPRLFGGGRAGLVLTEEAPGVEQGVEIVAQPPGKKLQSVMLLSGGEKALTAVGLIFAIFLIKPTPFCLLDEVDAPLDEGNVGRYNDLLREMSKTSQFILITHSRRTMEVADTLYGVTMEEPGISKLVSVRLRDAAAANDDQAVA